MCTRSIQITVTLQVWLWPTQWFKGYDHIVIFLFSFLIGFSFLKKKKRFGFNLLVVIYGIFNFLAVVGMDRSGMTQEMAVRNQKVSRVLWITEVTTSS